MTPDPFTPVEVRRTARVANDAGLCVLPPKEDGTKAPMTNAQGSWKQWQEQRTTPEELEAMYSDGRTGIGLVCGNVSGNLELFEFDDLTTYEAYKQLAEASGLGPLVERIEAGYLENTPGAGIHWFYFCEEIARNTKLARRPKLTEERAEPNDKWKVLIETRGQGGYAIIAPSYGSVHPSGNPYHLLQGSIGTIPTITTDERRAIWEMARAFDQSPKQEPREAKATTATPDHTRPGDEFNRSAEWSDILSPRGWKRVYERAGTEYWRRPGKGQGISATTNFQDSELLFVFSDSTDFDPERGYSKFSAYALLEHGGDFTAAAKALAGEGYGNQQDRSSQPNANGRGPEGVSAPYEAGEPEWEAPQPFDSVEVPAFPVRALPADIAEYVMQEATAKQTPVDLPGCLVLGALSAAAGGKFNISLSSDWTEPLNEYLAIALLSGERKSPVFRSVFKPMEDVERERAKEKAPEILKVQTERDILEKRWQNAKTEAAKAKSPEERTSAEADAMAFADELAKFTVPAMPRLLADDATPEAVAGLLAEQGGRLAIISTEGGIFEIIGGRYSEKVPNLDVYLKAYSGDTVRVDRRSRPPEFVANPSLTVVLTVQPDVITDLAERRAFRGRGFLARWLYSLPQSCVGFRDINAPPVQPEPKEMWNQTLRYILEVPNPGADGIPLLHLSEGAHDIFQSFRAEVETNLRPGGELDDLADWGNKLAGTVARLAGLLHSARRGVNSVYSVDSVYRGQPWDELVEPDTMIAAINLGKYFEAHAKAAFALMGSGARLAVAKRVWAAIVRHNLDSFKVRDLWQHVRRSFSNVGELEQALSTLEELDYIRALRVPKREGPGQPPSPMFEVNPRACTRNPRNPRNPRNSDAVDIRPEIKGSVRAASDRQDDVVEVD